jgi:hypothetical protein
MGNYSLIKEVSRQLKYKHLPEFTGREVLLDISSPELNKNIESLIQENLGLSVHVKTEDIIGSIAKYGIIDLTLEVLQQIDYPEISGLKILKDFGFLAEDAKTDYKGNAINADVFFTPLRNDLLENKHYLKIFAEVITKESWWSLHPDFFKQLLNVINQNKPLVVQEKDKIQLFTILDVCYTNYTGIWLFKHFYM